MKVYVLYIKTKSYVPIAVVEGEADVEEEVYCPSTSIGRNSDGPSMANLGRGIPGTPWDVKGGIVGRTNGIGKCYIADLRCDWV